MSGHKWLKAAIIAFSLHQPATGGEKSSLPKAKAGEGCKNCATYVIPPSWTVWGNNQGWNVPSASTKIQQSIEVVEVRETQEEWKLEAAMCCHYMENSCPHLFLIFAQCTSPQDEVMHWSHCSHQNSTVTKVPPVESRNKGLESVLMNWPEDLFCLFWGWTNVRGLSCTPGWGYDIIMNENCKIIIQGYFTKICL